MKFAKGMSGKTRKNSQGNIEVAPTKYFVRKHTGVADDELVRIILATGADRSEIREASERYFEDRYIRPTVFKSMSAGARKVYDLLEYDRLRGR